MANGAETVDVCRKHGISDVTFYKYKAKYGGIDGEAEKQMIL